MVGALVATDLDGTLEVNLHRVGELEGLEVGVGEDGCRGAKVFDLGESAHELRSRYATALVHKLDGASFAIVRETIPNKHVEFVLLVLDCEHHCHGLADFHDAGHLACPGTWR